MNLKLPNLPNLPKAIGLALAGIPKPPQIGGGAVQKVAGEIMRGHGAIGFAEVVRYRQRQLDLATMVLRDRNAPSIIFWSVGNEIGMRSTSAGAALCAQLAARALEAPPRLREPARSRRAAATRAAAMRGGRSVAPPRANRAARPPPPCRSARGGRQGGGALSLPLPLRRWRSGRALSSHAMWLITSMAMSMRACVCSCMCVLCIRSP